LSSLFGVIADIGIFGTTAALYLHIFGR